jgi:hypothetical protein
MSEPDINKLREDLETMRLAAGVDLPFSKRDICIMTPVACMAGAAIACIGWWVPAEYKWAALFPIAILLGVWLILARADHRRRATEPVHWRETRYGLMGLFIVTPLLAGFLYWETAMGLSGAALQSSVSFFGGLGIAWFGLIDRTRRHYIGTALPFLVFGMLIPFCDPRQIRAGVGLMLIVMALLTAAIQIWQLRTRRGSTDAN